MKMKKQLSLLLVLTLVVSLFCGMGAQAAEEEVVRLAFTSDVHHSTGYEQNNLQVWLGNIEQKVGYIDTMGFCGDMGSAYAANAVDYWSYVQANLDMMDGEIEAGKVGQAVYTFGNHEWYPYAGGDYQNHMDDPAALRLQRMGEAVKTEDYIIYCFGAGSIAASFGQGYDLADIQAADEYLAAAPTDIPIFVLTHFPAHYFDGRTTLEAAALIDVLNKYPNVTLLWGHNHTVFDTYYDIFYQPGSELVIDAAGTKKEINFTYCSAGCMSDAEYSGPEGGSAFIQGKGLIVTIDNGKLDYTYYTMNGEPVLYLTSDGPFTVFFRDGLDSTFFDEQIIAYGEAATAPALPVHEGFKFTGWSESFDKVTSNLLIEANFEEIKIPVEAEAPAEAGVVYVTVEVDGELAVGKSGKAVASYPVPYVEGMTIAEAFIKLHELEYPEGTDGIVSSDTGYGFASFSKLWGKNPANGALAFTAANYIDSNAKAVAGGSYYAMAYDTAWKTTSLVTPSRVRIPVGKEATLRAVTMSMNSDYTYTAKGLASDLYQGSSQADMTDTGKDIGATGYFTVSFDKAGSYYLCAKDTSGAASDAAVLVEVYEPVVVPSTQTVTVDGTAITADVYNIDGSNYFKLRDIASALNGSAAQFSVDYDSEARAITAESGKAYTAVGGELTVGEDKSATAVPSSQSLSINGEAVAMSAFNIGGSNYFQLRELGAALDFAVDYDAETRTVLIVTVKPEPEPEAPSAVEGKYTLSVQVATMEVTYAPPADDAFTAWETTSGTSFVSGPMGYNNNMGFMHSFSTEAFPETYSTTDWPVIAPDTLIETGVLDLLLVLDEGSDTTKHAVITLADEYAATEEATVYLAFRAKSGKPFYCYKVTITPAA